MAIADNFDMAGNFFNTTKKIEPIKQCNLFMTRKNTFFKSKLMKMLLQKVKFLYIKNAPLVKSTYLNLKLLFKELTQIEVLEIDTLRIKWITIKSTSLKILSILDSSNNAIILSTPNLVGLRTYGRLSNFDFSPSDNSITHLSVQSFNLSEIERFKNLVYLSSDDGFGNGDLLARLTKLRELHCKTARKENVNNLLKQAKVLRRIDFNFYFRGINICSEDDSWYLEKPDQVKKFLMNNFDRVHKFSKIVSSIEECDYSQLIKHNRISEKFFRKFFTKFSNIHVVVVQLKDSEILDLNAFSRFIECCTYIDDLTLDNVALGQSFYNKLDTLCPYLSHLTINR